MAESRLATLFLLLTALGVLLLPPVAADLGADTAVAPTWWWCLGTRPETDMAGVDTAITLLTLLQRKLELV